MSIVQSSQRTTARLASWCCLLVMVVSPLFGATEVIQLFDGVANGNPYAGGGVPPDPHGAAGPNGILASVNTGLAYYSKVPGTNDPARIPLWQAPLGTNLVSQTPSTNAFWATPGYTGAGISDPKVIYDLTSGRFFVVMQETPADQSFINLAVSRSSNPASGTPADWLLYRWEVTRRWDFGLGEEIEVGIDYPGFAVDRRTVTATFNTFNLDEQKGLNDDGSNGSEIFVFDKQRLISGAGDQPRVFENHLPLGVLEALSATTTIQPAQPIGKSDPGNRIFGVELHQKFPAILDEWAIRLHVINDPLGEFNYQDEDVDIDRPGPDPGGAPQPADPTRPLTAAPIDTEANRPLSACHFEGKIWTVYTQEGNNSNSVIHWVAIQPKTKADGGSVIAEDGFIDSGPGVWTYMPCLSAGPRGDLCLIYTQSSLLEAPSAYFRLRPAGSSVWEPPVRLKASSNSLLNYSSDKKKHRWGDYAAVSVDPVDDSFWVTHEYVNAAGTNNWNTLWAQIAACRWPIIVSQPVSITTTACVSGVSFSVSARPAFTDAEDPVPNGAQRFIWRHNGTEITTGEHFRVFGNDTDSTLAIVDPGFSDEGFYDVKVLNECGEKYATISQSASLLITPLPSWSTIEPTVGEVRPPNRSQHAMVYIPPIGRCLLFGGDTIDTNRFRSVSADTWTWDGLRWSRLFPSKSPPARHSFGMAYDSTRQRVVLFGGGAQDPGGTSTVFGDTWEWDGLSWDLRMPAGSNAPPAREHPTMAYDSTRGETLLIGGDLLDRADRGKTWGWNGTNWTLRSTAVPAGLIGPFEVSGATAMAFDERRERMVLFGPFFASDNDVWEWDGGGWERRTATVRTPFDGVVDSRNASAFYDPHRGLVGCVGGNNGQALWYWDGIRFLRNDTLIDGTPPSSTFPFAAGVAFDSTRRALVWSGGNAESLSPLHRTREIRFVDGPLVERTSGDVSVEPGQAASIRAAVSGASPLVYEWRRNDLPLTNSAQIKGADTPVLSIAAAQDSDAGHYKLFVQGPCGFTFGPSIRLAVGPFMTLVDFGKTHRVWWNDINAVLEEAPTAIGPWSPRPGVSSPFELPLQDGAAQFFQLRRPAN